MGILGNAFMSLFLDEKARKAAIERGEINKQRRHAQKQARIKASNMTERERTMAEMREKVGDVMTPERQELIAHAMKVRTAKAKILDDLNDEDKQKLYAIAIKAMLREGDDEPKE